MIERASESSGMSTMAGSGTGWSEAEVATVAFAVQRAPSVHNTQPWVLEFRDGAVALFERWDLSLPSHDETGRDRLISCGAALANLVLGVRAVGREAVVELLPDPARPAEVARIVAAARRDPSTVEHELHAAIPHRHSYRMPFTDRIVTDDLCRELVGAARSGEVSVRPIQGAGDTVALAALLTQAGRLLRQDRGYQRELTIWTNTLPSHRSGGGLPRTTLTYDTLPWVGLVRTSTALPAPNVLAGRLSRECLLLVHTAGDDPADHLRAGQAAQRIWLAATHAGLAGSIFTQPLRVPEVRAGLAEHLDLDGYAQALLRFGYPARRVPPSSRMPVTELIK